MQTRLKQLICGVAASAACFSANAASTSTETIDLGIVSAGTTKSFNRAVIEADVPPTTFPIGFTDYILFQLPVNGGSAYSVVDFPVPALGLGLTFASLALFSAGADGLAGTVDDAAIPGASVSGTSGSLALSVGALPAGKMFMFVSGFTTGPSGGLYNGSVAVFPVPVPEPETWAMMLIGAGLVGFRLRNRSKKAAASRLV